MGDIKTKEAIKLTGTVRVYSHPTDTKFDRATAKLEVEQKNILMQSPNYGLDLLIQQLVGMTTYPLTLQYGEIGTGSTTPTVADTALTTPTNRAFVTFQQDFGCTDAIVQFIFSDSQLANGTYYEFGVFAGGTSTIGSGQLFNHALFATPYTKTAGSDTTVEVDFNFS
jgi:hypothetical protein